MRRALSVAAVLAAGLAAWAGTSDAFRVRGALQGPIVHQAGPMYWERECWGTTVREVVTDAEWTRCVGVPHGPRRCYGYPEIPDSLASSDVALPLGPLREIPCPGR